MQIDFLSPDAAKRARPDLEHVLEEADDQLALACAFLTGGGATVLKQYAARLRGNDSFAVFSYGDITQVSALNVLHGIAPGRVFIHLGFRTPDERGVGPGLMHSKVFLARTGRKFTLWVGSHNLTASALTGVNREAALVVRDTTDNPIFSQAMSHLMQCRSEAVVFDPFNLPPEPPSTDTLIIHAEREVGLADPPFFVHLMPNTTRYDRLLQSLSRVWLYLYAPGTLSKGKKVTPERAYSGTVTGVNYAQDHPRAGTPADWPSAQCAIEQRRNMFFLVGAKGHTTAPTQGVFRIEMEEEPETLWLSDQPTPAMQKVVHETYMREVDSDLRKYFKRSSLHSSQLIHQAYGELRKVLRLRGREVQADNASVAQRLDMPDSAQLQIVENEEDADFTFIYRARYRR